VPGEKGSYRSVYQAIWDDEEFQGFDLDTQWAFFALRTIRDCNFPCIFVFYRPSLYERIPNINEGTRTRIDAGIDALIDAGWVKYQRPVLWIVKGLKNDPSFVPGNGKQIKGIDAILRGLPNIKLVDEFREYYNIHPKIRPASTMPPSIPASMPASMPPSKQGTGTGTGTGSGTGTGKGTGESTREGQPVDNSRGAVAPSGGLEAPRVAAPVERGGKSNSGIEKLLKQLSAEKQERAREAIEKFKATEFTVDTASAFLRSHDFTPFEIGIVANILFSPTEASA